MEEKSDAMSCFLETPAVLKFITSFPPFIFVIESFGSFGSFDRFHSFDSFVRCDSFDSFDSLDSFDTFDIFQFFCSYSKSISIQLKKNHMF